MLDAIAPYATALLPTIGVAGLFYYLMKAIIEADRRERVAQSKWEQETHQTLPPARPLERSGTPQPISTPQDSEDNTH